MFIEESNQLLEPGYQSIETGYFRLSNGVMHVRVLTRLPRCHGKMLKWWTRYLDSTEKYKLWHPVAHLAMVATPKGHNLEELIGGKVWKSRMERFDPAEIFDVTRFEKAGVEALWCGNHYNPGTGSLMGRSYHFFRKTYFGCEARSRFWLLNVPDEAGPDYMQHCLEEMGYLADFLPDLYTKETGPV